MDIDRVVTEIEQLEAIFSDTRPLSTSDLGAANRRQDEKHARVLGFDGGNVIESVAELNPLYCA
jgi:hypothetical protein